MKIDMKELAKNGSLEKRGSYEVVHIEKNEKEVFNDKVDTYIWKGGHAFTSHEFEVGIDYDNSGHTRTYVSFEFNGGDTVEIEHTKNGIVIKTIGACERADLVTLLTNLADILEGFNEKYEEGGYA